jgi:alkanesulfonate monooxygenase SsuD/methylene tetrahydromethanopterin reductase-like flavin-dependent oxidoreductase (luciferase family)
MDHAAGAAPRTTTWALRFDLRVRPEDRDRRSTQYRAALSLAEQADRAGCSSIIVSEHHGAEDGYLPSTLTFAAAVAARTSQARITVSALILPLLEPLHTAEETLVVDQLSNGRVDVIVGLGYVRSEYEMFGLRAADRVRLLERKLPVYLQALTGEQFVHEGRSVRLTPEPVQQPRPTVLLAASVAAAARRAARIADGVHCLVPRGLVAPHYAAERARLGLDAGLIVGGEGSPGSIFVADDPDRAWHELAPYLLHETNAYGRWALENGANQHLYQPTDDITVARSSGMYEVLTPDEAVMRFCDAGSAGVILNPLVGGLPPGLAERYLWTFIDRVLPKALVSGAENRGDAHV